MNKCNCGHFCDRCIHDEVCGLPWNHRKGIHYTDCVYHVETKEAKDKYKPDEDAETRVLEKKRAKSDSQCKKSPDGYHWFVCKYCGLE